MQFESEVESGFQLEPPRSFPQFNMVLPFTSPVEKPATSR